MKPCLSNQEIITAAKTFATPLYLYDEAAIIEKYVTLRKSITSDCEIYYSMKANPAIAICQLLRRRGSGCEVSSGHELLMAVEAGFYPKDIIFVGPAKKEAELVLALDHGIKHIICESIDEINLLNKIAYQKNKKASILIRINPDFKVNSAPIKMSGVPSQFGVTVSKIISEKAALKQLKNIRIEGLHVYNASRVLNADELVKNVENILSMASYIERHLAIVFKTIDVGGGLGVPYFSSDDALDFTKFSSGFNRLITQFKKKNKTLKIILELGRYLIADAGILITEVCYVKHNHGKYFVVVDGGTHCHLGITGMGSFVHRNFPARHVALSKKVNEEPLIKYQIVGPLCTPGDTLLREASFSKVAPGDLIVIEKTGAYGLSASPNRFLSHGAPAEAILSQGKLYLIRRRENMSDLLATQLY